MCQIERNWHVIVRLITSITEHHTLVTSPLVLIITIVNTTVYIITLLMNSRKNTTAITIKLIFSLGITNVINGLTCYGLQINIFFRAYFAHDDNLPCRIKSLYSATRMLVISQELVEQSITYLVGNLIRMSL